MSQTKAQLVSGTTAQDLTVDNINTTSINSGQTSGRKNLIINGAMQVAQRGTSTTAAGYGSIDRISRQVGGTDEAPVFAQVDVASGTTPFTNGFRKALKITNGNQTSGAGSADYVYFWYIAEAQDIANSGWNYTDSNSFITLSFWVKSSVAQNFYGVFYTADGTPQTYVWETGSLTADTWTKITKTVPGNSNLQFDNDNGAGLYVAPIRAFDGTDRTASMSLNTWGAFSSSSRTPDATSTWYTTNDATLEITGLQLEVGSTATDFEHRGFGEEYALCQRYYQRSYSYGTAIGATTSVGAVMHAAAVTQTYASPGSIKFPVNMRAIPTITIYSAQTGTAGKINSDSTDGNGTAFGTNETGTMFTRSNDSSGVGVNAFLRVHYVADAEL
jgi:hypothetical protein